MSQVRFPPRYIFLDIIDKEEGMYDKEHTIRMIRIIRMRIMKMRMNFNNIDN